ncbi:hypothetical protein HOO54_04330 [Bacillus sp. WMMC1349]|uniref:hypothetical protein n=1 Tax=Bacillus sp. WMMC1349 TaxID=2736254 RepID=UPI001554541B|nr:hypothetical protein [Bacillus sp. WMMC1349]NPC91492.1 hypothetical protein [Bacillus sp. WMMC1349]
MEHILTCTSEELGMIASICGFHGAAKEIMEASLGKRSDEQWDAIAASTINQLILKGYWDEEKSAKNENPFTEDMQQFITSYLNSRQLIHCYLKDKNILMLHHIEKELWLLHIIDRDIIHEFAYVEQQEISNLIIDYYHFSPKKDFFPLELRLSDQCFDWLRIKEKVQTIRKESFFSTTEEHCFNQLIEDLEENEWSINSISIFHIPDLDVGSKLTNITFFIPSAHGVWVVKYDEHHEKPVHISLYNLEQWYDLTKSIESFAIM